MESTAVPMLPVAEHPAFDFEESAGGIEAYRLRSNRMQVLVLPEAAAPVVACMVTYHVGSRNEATGLTGATHFLEHLMFKGTTRFHEREGTSIFKVLQRVGAKINATTWLDRTNYYAVLPREHLPLAVEIEADRMRGALLDADDMEAERTVILNEYDRGQNEPLRNLFHAVWSTAFVAHPYHHPTIGWRSDIETASVAGLRHFYDTFYWPNNATLSIIGDVDRYAALDLVARHFEAIPASSSAIPAVRTREPEQRGERRVTIKQAGQVGAVMRAYKAPSGLHADADALDVLTMLLASGKNSRLYRALTDQGLTTHAGASLTRLRDPGLFYFIALLTPERTHQEVEDALHQIVETLQEEGVTEEEIERARNQLVAQEAFGRDGPYAVAAQLNEAIAVGDWKLYAEYLDRIRNVTPSDVQRVAQEYLHDDRCTTGWYVPV